MDIFNQAEEAAAFILSKTKMRPAIAIVLGSGLGDFADSLIDAVRATALPFMISISSVLGSHAACSGDQ